MEPVAGAPSDSPSSSSDEPSSLRPTESRPVPFPESKPSLFQVGADTGSRRTDSQVTTTGSESPIRMRRYANLSGDSGVTGYEIGPDFIRVEFQDAGVYRYTYASTGAREVEDMKRLAAAGRGLATYVNMRVRDRYDRRERQLVRPAPFSTRGVRRRQPSG